MGILLMLKEGGSLGIDTIGNKPLDEDLDFLEESGISLVLRLTYGGLSVTSVTATTPRDIVLGDS